MAIYEAKNYTYYLQKNETPKMFDPISAEMFGGSHIMLVSDLIEKRTNFLNLKSDLKSLSRFLRYPVTNTPYFYRFFDISSTIDQPG